VKQAMKHFDQKNETKIVDAKTANLFQELLLDVYKPYKPEAE
jgi:hypothetical protein